MTPEEQEQKSVEIAQWLEELRESDPTQET